MKRVKIESLDDFKAANGDGFSVNDVSYPTIVTGVIPIRKGFRGSVGLAKMNGKGKPITMTPRGYCFDEVKSALQKSIRRGLVAEAIYWGMEMYSMGGPFRSNLVNRLKIIASEDISIANPTLVIYVAKTLEKFADLIKSKKENDQKQARKYVIVLIAGMAKSKKCRLTDSIIHATMEPDVKEWPKGHGVLEVKEYSKKVYKGLMGDNEKYVKYMNQFIHAIRKKKEQAACYWAQKIYDIDPSERGCTRRNTYKGRSKDPMYGIWNYLLRKTKGIHNDVVKALLQLYDDRKDGRTERLFLVHAILHICRKDDLKDLDLDNHELFNVGNYWKEYRKIEVLRMPVWAVDKHTVRGVKLGKNSNDFWTEGGLLVNEADIKDVYLERAKVLNSRRDKEKIKGPVRKRSKGKQRKNKRKRGKKGLERDGKVRKKK